MAKITVLLVDDHTVVRQGLRRILEAEPQIEIVAELGDGPGAIVAAEKLKPAVAIVDLSLPSMSGIEVTRQLGQRTPSTKVLILSMHADEAYVQQGLRAGARGYLLKDADDQDLVKAVIALAAGGSYFSPAVSKLLLNSFVDEDTKRGDEELAILSPRERQVLQLIGEGKSNKEVAQLLDLGVSTIESHRKHVMEKLDLHNTAAIVRFAVRKGLVRA